MLSKHGTQKVSKTSQHSAGSLWVLLGHRRDVLQAVEEKMRVEASAQHLKLRLFQTGFELRFLHGELCGPLFVLSQLELRSDKVSTRHNAPKEHLRQRKVHIPWDIKRLRARRPKIGESRSESCDHQRRRD